VVTLIVDDGSVAADIRHAEFWIARWSSAFVALMSYNLAYLNAARGVALDCLAIVMLLLSASGAVALVQRVTTVQAKSLLSRVAGHTVVA